MFQNIRIENVGGFDEHAWSELENINVVIGPNDTGKTYLLKLLYTIARSTEEHRKGQNGDRESWSEVLARKLRWVFQPPDFQLGKLVQKGEDRLTVESRFCNESVYFAFGRSTEKQIRDTNAPPLEENDNIDALFFPPKEVLTAIDAIAQTRDELRMQGFGDTYLDLIRSLRRKGIPGAYKEPLDEVKERLESLFEGHVRYNEGEFLFKRGNEKYNMPQTAEGIKKIGILMQLIMNRSINEGSILFFDEPEANLHPRAMVQLVEMLYQISQAGVQVFLATHDYFIIKKLELLAREHDESISVNSLVRTEEGDIRGEIANLKKGLPSNPITDVSKELLEKDLQLGGKGR
jgi:AAA15 family ATPase/GTPase